MAFKKQRGPFVRKIEVEDGESYTLLLNIPSDVQINGSLVTRHETPAETEGEPPTVTWENNGIIANWEDVMDTETGEPLPFTPENLAEFLSDTMILGEVWRVVVQLRNDAIAGKLARKNSKAPRGGGSGTAPRQNVETAPQTTFAA